MNQDIRWMKLHEIIVINENVEVMRVAGGWIYKMMESGDSYGRPVFVPYDTNAHNDLIKLSNRE